MSVADYLGQETFHFPYVRFDLVGNQTQYVVVNLLILTERLCLQNCHPHFKVGRLYVRYESSLKTGSQSFLQRVYFLRRSVRADYDLFVCKI